MKSISKLSVPPFIFAISLCGLLLTFCGCSATPNLSKDASLRTEWGTVLQYKINSDWHTVSDYSSDSQASIYYANEESKDTLSIEVDNTNSSVYKYSSASTFGDYLDLQEEYFSQTAEQQARSYKDYNSHSSSSIDLSKAENHPDYSDYSISEIKKEKIDGVEFRIYKQSYTATYSDSYVQTIHQNNPDSNFQKIQHATKYLALVKDGRHDLEITANNEALLNAFLETLSVRW